MAPPQLHEQLVMESAGMPRPPGSSALTTTLRSPPDAVHNAQESTQAQPLPQHLHGGQIQAVLGPVLQGCQLGDLLELLVTGLHRRKHIEEPLEVVREDLRGKESTRGWVLCWTKGAAHREGAWLDHHLHVLVTQFFCRNIRQRGPFIHMPRGQPGAQACSDREVLWVSKSPESLLWQWGRGPAPRRKGHPPTQSPPLAAHTSLDISHLQVT